VVRLLRDIAWVFQSQPMALIIVAPQFNVPPDLDKDVVLLEWPLPTPEELLAILSQIANEVKTQEVKVSLENGVQEKIVSALQGLTSNEAANALSMSVIANGKLDESAIPVILSEKKQIIKRTGYLEFWEADVTAKDIGGLRALKEYTTLKLALFSAEAEAYGTDRPKGYLMVGVPGSGKSLTAKATTGGIMPLLRLNMAALMGGPMGQSENNLRHALRMAEAVGPCVLWIDEIEKAIATDVGELTDGTSKRMFGEILTWMEERTAPVYVVATANRAEILQSELLSRFDDIWFVDLPAEAEREEIVRIHLAKRGRNPEDFDVAAVVEATAGYVGREIEKIVKTALNFGFVDGARPITTGDLLYAAKRVMPISKVKPEEIEAMRKWGAKYALNASGDGDEPAEAVVTKRARRLEL
jgi:AAA+ superfamily predicted ATPase